MALRCTLALALAFGFLSGASAQEKLKFEPKFEANKAFYQKVSTKVDQVVKVQGGADLNLKHEQTFLFKWLPTKLEAEKWTVKLTIEGAILKVDIASNPVNYDSTADQPAAGNNPGLADFFKNLIGTEFTITYAKGMVVEKVEGREDFLKKLGTSNPQMQELLKKLLTDEAMKEMADPTAGLMPGADKAAGIAAGETWEKKTNMPLGPIGTYDRTLSFKYVGKDTEKKDLDKVEVTAKLLYKAPNADADGLLFRIKGATLDTVDPKAGTFLFDSKLGQIVTGTIAVRMSGKLNVTIGTTETEVQLVQDQTTTLETSDKSYLPVKK